MLDRLKYLEQWVKVCVKIDARVNEWTKMLGLDIDSPLIQTLFEFETEYTSVCSQIVGDKSEWLNWYAFENDYGKKELEAGIPGEMKRIVTLDDLLTLIDLKVSE
jgi:hypothetical protein